MEKYEALSQSATVDNAMQIETTREYIRELLNKAYDNKMLATDDAVAIASLAIALDRFLADSETKKQTAITLREELCQIADNGKSEKIISGHYERKIISHKNLYYTNNGEILYLGEFLGSGGEGAVYKIMNMPGKVAKIFTTATVTDDQKRKKLERKIKALINMHVSPRLDNILINTVPEGLIYDKENTFVGYIMPLIATKFKLFDVTRDSVKRKKYFPELDYRGLIIVAYNLAEAVNYMHEHDIVIGDLNQSNVLVNPDGTVCLIDTDSWDFVDKDTNEHFSCTVGVRELLAPELQAIKSLRTGSFTKKSDAFSLAILIFRLLMNNAEPFGGVKYDSLVSRSVQIPVPMPISVTLCSSIIIEPSSNPNLLGDHKQASAIMNGECPYIKKIEGITIPSWVPSYDILPAYIQKLFTRTFDYTSDTYKTQICERPTAKEWMEALMRFYNEPLKQCEKDSFHWYRPELMQCPFCAKINPFSTQKWEDKENEVSGISVGILSVGI